tara:strand:- start:257 stop:502 length:246 start_codon:yes stop_codon:yes gene_type:complete
MRDIRKYKGRLHTVKRLKSSFNGNPRFLVCITTYDKPNVRIARTFPDSMEGYAISNFEGKLVDCEIGIHRNNLHIQNIRKI